MHSNISTVFEIHNASLYCSHMKKKYITTVKKFLLLPIKNMLVFRIEKFLSKHEISSLETAESNLHLPNPISY
jgi:hypothetical protein